MVDDPIIHMPAKVRYWAVGFLVIASISFLGLSIYLSGRPGYSDAVLISMSILQIMLTATGLLFIFGFSQRSLSIKALQDKITIFLAEEVTEQISALKFNLPNLKKYPSNNLFNEIPIDDDFNVQVGLFPNDFRADYLITRTKNGDELLIDVNMRVKEVMLVFKIVNDSNVSVDELMEKLGSWAIPDSIKEGTAPKKVNRDIKLGGRPAIHLFYKAMFDERFLVTPADRLYCAQCIAFMVRDLFVISDQNSLGLLKKINYPSS